MAQRTPVSDTALVDGVPVDALVALMKSVRDLGKCLLLRHISLLNHYPRL